MTEAIISIVVVGCDGSLPLFGDRVFALVSFRHSKNAGWYHGGMPSSLI